MAERLHASENRVITVSETRGLPKERGVIDYGKTGLCQPLLATDYSVIVL